MKKQTGPTLGHNLLLQNRVYVILILCERKLWSGILSFRCSLLYPTAILLPSFLSVKFLHIYPSQKIEKHSGELLISRMSLVYSLFTIKTISHYFWIRTSHT